MIRPIGIMINERDDLENFQIKVRTTAKRSDTGRQGSKETLGRPTSFVRAILFYLAWALQFGYTVLETLRRHSRDSS